MLPLFRILTAAAVASCALNTPVAPAGVPAHARARSTTPATAVPDASVLTTNTHGTTALGPTALAPTALGAAALAADASTARWVAVRRLPQHDVTRAVARQARRIIDAHGREPFGTEIPFEAEGRTYIARIEQHYHPPGGEKRPWGPHPGVSVFVASATHSSSFAAN